MWPYVYGVLIFMALVAIYVITYVKNEKTMRPKNSESEYEEAKSCTACGSLEKFTVPDEVIEKFKEEHL